MFLLFKFTVILLHKPGCHHLERLTSNYTEMVRKKHNQLLSKTVITSEMPMSTIALRLKREGEKKTAKNILQINASWQRHLLWTIVSWDHEQ